MSNEQIRVEGRASNYEFLQMNQFKNCNKLNRYFASRINSHRLQEYKLKNWALIFAMMETIKLAINDANRRQADLFHRSRILAVKTCDLNFDKWVCETNHDIFVPFFLISPFHLIRVHFERKITMNFDILHLKHVQQKSNDAQVGIFV